MVRQAGMHAEMEGGRWLIENVLVVPITAKAGVPPIMWERVCFSVLRKVMGGWENMLKSRQTGRQRELTKAFFFLLFFLKVLSLNLTFFLDSPELSSISEFIDPLSRFFRIERGLSRLITDKLSSVLFSRSLDEFSPFPAELLCLFRGRGVKY